MAGIVSVSQKDLAQRRQKIRRQRQIKIIQALWRTAAISGLAGGLLWVALQPIWVLNAPKQIEMKSGDKLLSEATIESLLVISYPQSLWRIQPNAIANSLKQQPTIAQATVNRRLFPPGLNIKIEERVPVAIAQSPKKQSPAGLLDATGVLIPLEKYKLVNPNIKLPILKVIGSPEKYRSSWSQIYAALSQSPVKIMEIDCQDPTNLILKTELGNVHLGAFSPQLTEQIKVLAQMRSLSAKMDFSQIQYIDLKNPASPLVHLNQTNKKPNSQNP
ncbi:cell division protein FtsQ/DivIB [Nodularia spumigena]|uniref:cell division protein FtsQ/DivIB n=2 Tax=Cyanobacteriota TaxID=1117 RepID=UPI00232CA9F9|nr:FtsQ-type POTRA domain-containing protein [Nodularia spumigena]MDB9306328.1 FtsQ-type POTRA domain-containing protein [Nodularia spumigena CS-591/12]MDB9318501.1 FtsQ-type POTRA domain-containing protein [Nodularia spumigena CS-590/01A]MDB9321558.1 FtsQ-type POTRA domain-containing protein [Nodularia spumigena CS-591/07A]MDB9327143.1 FtsQ-type POTRA domain-containing protein [Nodularia spumigena CS-590/02]MDB9331160.1 FtsQ-type POTRA domain-containing protein [Nodularia spumigena CS-591/04]